MNKDALDRAARVGVTGEQIDKALASKAPARLEDDLWRPGQPDDGSTYKGIEERPPRIGKS